VGERVRAPVILQPFQPLDFLRVGQRIRHFRTTEARRSGVGTIFVNDAKVTEGKIDKTPAYIFSADEGTDVGRDGETNVTNDYKEGNTLICKGTNGTFTEVTPTKEVVWRYVNPVPGGPPSGSPPAAPGGRGGGAEFRATRIPPDHAGLVGKKLIPGVLLEEQVLKDGKGK
jgi:hypothetical protein